MTNTSDSNISDLLTDASLITDEVRQSFGALSSQFNWKPQPGRWSVAQCLDHLVTSNATYFPIFEAIISGRKQRTLWERIPLLPRLYGKLLIKALNPQSIRKLKAPTMFRPTNSDLDGDIIEKFIDQQRCLMDYIKQSAYLKLNHIIMASPAASFITYSVADAYQIILVHEKRHLAQAQRVMASTDFPQSLSI